jgi:hypothetical protein
MNPNEQIIIEGNAGKIAVSVGATDDERSRGALIIGSKAGGFDKLTAKKLGLIGELADWLNTTESGGWVAVRSGYRPMAVIQSNQSVFYKSRHLAESGFHARVWIDFYFRTLYAAMQLIAESSKTDGVVLHHPTAGIEAWNESFTATAVDVISHFADRPENGITTVALSCPHALKPAHVKNLVDAAGIGERQKELGAVESLSYGAKRLQNRYPERSRFKEFGIEQVNPEDVGCPAIAGVSLFKIDIPTQVELTNHR